MTPAANMLRTMRWTMSSRRACGTSPAEDGLLEGLAEEVVVAGLVHVEAGERGLDGGVGATPVGEDEALEAPVLLEDLVEGVVVLAGVVAVDVVVGAHDAGGVGVGDGDLEGEQVGLAQGAGIEDGVEGVAAGLLIVEGVVLDVAHDVVGLHAGGELADHGAGEDGVFARSTRSCGRCAARG